MTKSNPVTEQARKLQGKGVGGDNHLVHMNSRELAVLEAALGRGPVKNPHTGLPSFEGTGGEGTGEGPGSDGPTGGNGPGTGTGGSGSGNGGVGNSQDAPTGTTQSKDNMDTNKDHSIDGTPGGFGGAASITGIDAIDSVIGKIKNTIDHTTIGNVINGLVSMSPIGIANLGMKGLLGIDIGNIIDNVKSDIPAMTGLANQNNLSVLGFDTGLPSSIAGAVKGATIAGAQDNTDVGTHDPTANSNQGGANSAGSVAGRNSDNLSNLAKQPSFNPIQQQVDQQAPFTAAQLSSLFNQNTGGASNFNFGSAASSIDFSKLTLPNLDTLKTQPGAITGTNTALDLPSSITQGNKVPVDINDLAHPFLALMSSLGNTEVS